MAFIKKRRDGRVFDTSDPGTGKTRSHADAFAARRKKGGGCALVVAPKSLLYSAWANDIMQFCPQLTVSVATAENREKAFAVDADVYVTNTDAVKWLAKQKPAFFKKFDTLIIDEITAFKHMTSDRSKAIKKIVKYFPFRDGLTGTPNSNKITDIWFPVFLIDDGKRLGTSFFHFRAAVCTPKQVGPGTSMVEWVDKLGAEEAVAHLLRDINIRHKIEDCLDMPENFIHTTPFQMGKKHLAAYREMEQTAILELQDGMVTAVHAASLMTKLMQIASGAVYDQDGVYHLLDTARYELIMDLIGGAPHSIVFFQWQHQKEQLVQFAEKAGITFAIIDGSVPNAKTRQDIVQMYQAGFYDTLFIHPQSGAHGLTLTRGTRTIWASPTSNLEHFEQGNRRIYRAGQKLRTETIIVTAENTVEQKVYKRLLDKSLRMQNLLTILTGD